MMIGDRSVTFGTEALSVGKLDEAFVKKDAYALGDAPQSMIRMMPEWGHSETDNLQGRLLTVVSQSRCGSWPHFHL